jgi:hypothetical protein
MLINVVFTLSIFFHLLYWITKSLATKWGWAFSIHHEFNAVFGWYTILQFLAVVSLFADTVIRLDEWREKGQSSLRLSLSILCVFGWIVQILLAVVDLYTAGQLQ